MVRHAIWYLMAFLYCAYGLARYSHGTFSHHGELWRGPLRYGAKNSIMWYRYAVKYEPTVELMVSYGMWYGWALVWACGCVRYNTHGTSIYAAYQVPGICGQKGFMDGGTYGYGTVWMVWIAGCGMVRHVVRYNYGRVWVWYGHYLVPGTLFLGAVGYGWVPVWSGMWWDTFWMAFWRCNTVWSRI